MDGGRGRGCGLKEFRGSAGGWMVSEEVLSDGFVMELCVIVVGNLI